MNQPRFQPAWTVRIWILWLLQLVLVSDNTSYLAISIKTSTCVKWSIRHKCGVGYAVWCGVEMHRPVYFRKKQTSTGRGFSLLFWRSDGEQWACVVWRNLKSCTNQFQPTYHRSSYTPKDQVTRLICSKDSSSWQGKVRSLAWIMWTSRAVVHCEGNRISSTIYYTTLPYGASIRYLKIHYCKASNAVPKNGNQGSGQSVIKAGIWSGLASANPSLDVPQTVPAPRLTLHQLRFTTLRCIAAFDRSKKYYRRIWMRTCFVYSWRYYVYYQLDMIII